MATRPTTAPVAAPNTLGLPLNNQLMVIQVRAAMAAAVLGFAVVAGTVAMLAKVAVFVLLALAAISFTVGRRQA